MGARVQPRAVGALGALAAARHRLPVSLSFIGMDFKQILRRESAPLWLAVRYAKLITVTGERMRSGLIERGVPSQKIRILPHCIDTERFSPGSAEPDLDIISVGQLIPRKRMDVVIEAVALLRDRGITVRAGILGAGPLEKELARQIEERKVGDRVELLGYRNDVEAVVRRARIFALVSDWEGVPFAMIEAICAGLVPVVTDVGTISDWIRDDDNGHIVPVGDPRALADVIERLKKDPTTTPGCARRRSRSGTRCRSTTASRSGKTRWSDPDEGRIRLEADEVRVRARQALRGAGGARRLLDGDAPGGRGVQPPPPAERARAARGSRLRHCSALPRVSRPRERDRLRGLGGSRHEISHLDVEHDLNQPLPFPEARFDTVVLSDVLEHIARPEVLLGEIRRVLAPGGRLLLNVPFLYWLHEQPHDYYRFTEHALRLLIANAGLSLRLLEAFGGAPQILADVTSKHLQYVPVLGKTLARAVQRAAFEASRLLLAERALEDSRQRFPLGYFLVAERLDEAPGSASSS